MTSPTPVPPSRWRGTIWDPALRDEVPERFRSIYTVVLPLKYALFFGFGVAGSLSFIPVFSRVVSLAYADLWTLLVGIFSLAALIGLVFRIAMLELYATILLDVLLMVYVIALLVLGLSGDLGRFALSIGVPVFVVLPTWRVLDIIRTERRRRA